MFDIGFSEIVVIAVVALIVIGPERLPKVARTLGHMFGRLQRYVNEVKADISREMELEELRKLQTQVQGAARDFEQSMTQAARDVETGVRSVEAQLNDAEATAQATSSAASEAAVPRSSADVAAAGVQHPSSSSGEAEMADASAPDAAASSSDHSRQQSLPGFDRI